MKTISDEEIIATFGPSEEGTIMTLVPQHFEQGVVDYLAFYETLHDMCPEPFDGIGDLLTELQARGIRLAMVTGKGPKSTEISLRKFGMDGIFDPIETGSPAGPRKVEGIRNVLAAWSDLKPAEVLYVGDAPSDIRASREAGIAVAAAAWAETAEAEVLRALGPDGIYESVWRLHQTLLGS